MSAEALTDICRASVLE